MCLDLQCLMASLVLLAYTIRDALGVDCGSNLALHVICHDEEDVCGFGQPDPVIVTAINIVR